MNTIINPTKEEVKEFCKNLEEQLLAAVDRGSFIELSMGQKTKELYQPHYGQSPVNVLYVGAKFKAKFRERGY